MATMTTQQMLDDATAAYHALNTGTMAAQIRDANGELVEFTQTNKAALWTYIQQLQGQLTAGACIPGALGPLTSGPARFLF